MSQRLVALMGITAVMVAAILTMVGPLHQSATTTATTAATAPVITPPVQALTIHWMGHWQGEDKREVLVHEVAKEFAFKHPGVAIDLRFPAEIMGKNSKKMTARFIADQVRLPNPAWDVVWLDDQIHHEVAEILNDPKWAARELVDFTTLPGYAQAHKPFITADPYYRNECGGILPGPYIEGQYITMWVNKQVADQLGIQVKERGMEWSDLVGYAQQVQQARAKGNKVALLYESGDWLTTGFLFQSLVRSQFPKLEQAIAPGGDKAKLDAVRKAFMAFAELGRFDPLLPGHRERVWFASRDLPLQDACLFYVAGTWMYSHWKGLDPTRMDRMRPCELPGMAAVNHAIGGYIPTWAVLKRGPNPQVATDLLLSWCLPDVADRWASYTKNPTGLRGDLNRLRAATDPFEIFMLDMDARFGERVRMSGSPVYAFGPQGMVLGDALDAGLRELLEGHGDPQALAESLSKASQAKP